MNKINNQENALIELEKNLAQLISTPHGRRAFLKSAPFLISGCLAGCATVKADRNREGDNTGQDVALTPQEEKKLTQEILPKMEKDYPPHKNAYAQSYIRDLGEKIVQENNLKSRPYDYTFTVVDVNNVNAFALPAGTIYVTAPLIKMAESEAELAGVVGHEIGHVKARHAAERMAVAKREEKKSWAYALGGAVLGGAAGFGLGKLLCQKEDRECLRRAALYGGMAGVGGGLLIQKYSFMANSREDEMEADRIGFRTAYKAGFSKDHVGGFYTKLYQLEKKYHETQNPLLAPLADAMSTHPPGKERVEQMRQMAGSVPDTGGQVSSPSFKKLKKILGS